MRRGFTILETVLAAVVGLLVLTTAMAVLSSVRRTDMSLSARAGADMQFDAAQRFIRRATSSLLTSPTSASGEATSPGGRFLLRNNRVGGTMAPKIWMDSAGGPTQLFEVVLSEPLLTASRQGPAVLARAGAGPRSVDESLLTRADLSGYRGRFELRSPEDDGPRPEGAPPEYELWWSPLEPPDLPVGFDPRTLPLPVKLLDSVTFLRWRVFVERGWRDEYSARVTGDLPAYVELRIETAGGSHARWMFEIGWDEGEEYAPPEADDTETGEESDPDEALEGLPIDADDLPDELQQELERARSEIPEAVEGGR